MRRCEREAEKLHAPQPQGGNKHLEMQARAKAGYTKGPGGFLGPTWLHL